MKLAVLLLPSALVVAAYVPWVFQRRDLVFAVLVAANLGVLAAMLWGDQGPDVALVAAAVGAGLVFGVLLVRGVAEPEDSAIKILLLAAVVAGLLGWPAFAGADGLSSEALSSATLLALVMALGVGNIAFVAVRKIAPRVADLLVGWLARPGSDPWSLFERGRPPYFKSFLEVEVRRGRSVLIRCWGVSGFEADADDPIPVDEIEIPWPQEVPVGTAQAT